MYDGIDAEGVDKQVNSWLVIITHNTKDRNAKRTVKRWCYPRLNLPDALPEGSKVSLLGPSSLVVYQTVNII